MSAPTGTAWPPEQVALVLRLWNEDGLSAREIGAIVGRSKNAVIGIVHRGNRRSPGRVLVRPAKVRERFAAPEDIADTRSMFARMMGDPLPGRSALDLSRVKAVCGKPGIAGKTRSVAPTGREQDYLEDRHSNSEAVV